MNSLYIVYIVYTFYNVYINIGRIRLVIVIEGMTLFTGAAQVQSKQTSCPRKCVGK